MENKELLEILKRIDRKLTVVVGDIINRTTSSIQEQVCGLSKLKMSNPEIAEILGISTTHVAKEKSVSKKRKRGRK